MSKPDTAGRTVQATETTFAILETINGTDGIRLTQLADELDMAKSTVHRYLQTMLEAEYLVREGQHYHVGLRFLDLGWNARNRREGYRMAETKVAELAAQTDERAQFIVEEHGQAVYVHREIGDHAVQTDPGIGKRISLHATAAGKAIMAEWTDDRVADYVERSGLPAITGNTITETDVLFEELEEIRERGFSVNRGENIAGLRAVGAAVIGPEDGILGALSVSGPSNRMKGEWFDSELPDQLMGFANEIQLNLKYS